MDSRYLRKGRNRLLHGQEDVLRISASWLPGPNDGDVRSVWRGIKRTQWRRDGGRSRRDDGLRDARARCCKPGRNDARYTQTACVIRDRKSGKRYHRPVGSRSVVAAAVAQRRCGSTCPMHFTAKILMEPLTEELPDDADPA